MASDVRRCPRCGAQGILPLDQPHDPSGAILNPVMLCPVCDEEFRAEGMTWAGCWDVAKMTDGDIDRLIDQIVEGCFDRRENRDA